MDYPKFLDALRHLPFWLLVGLTAAGVFIIYGPHVRGMDFSAVRRWGWVDAATVLAGSLSLFRFIETVIRSYLRLAAHAPQRTLNLTVHSQIHTTFWAHNPPSHQPQTQIVADISAFNPSGTDIRIKAVRLIKPAVAAQEIQPIVFMVTNDDERNGSRLHPIPACQNAAIRVVILVSRQLGKKGKFIPARIGLTDQYGFEHKLKVRLWPSPGD